MRHSQNQITAFANDAEPVFQRNADVVHVLQAMRRIDEVKTFVLNAGKILRVTVSEIPARTIRDNQIRAVADVQTFARAIVDEKIFALAAFVSLGSFADVMPENIGGTFFEGNGRFYFRDDKNFVKRTPTLPNVAVTHGNFFVVNARVKKLLPQPEERTENIELIKETRIHVYGRNFLKRVGGAVLINVIMKFVKRSLFIFDEFKKMVTSTPA